MEENNINFTDIESEIYALVQSMNNLYIKYQNGVINDTFTQKAMKNAFNGLIKINTYLKEKNILLSDILEKMDFFKEYNTAIEKFRILSDLNKSDKFNDNLMYKKNNSITKNNKTLFELPSIASKVTSSFITLMDALKLEGQSHYLIVKLIKELRHNLKDFSFPGLDEIKYRIKRIQKEIGNNTHMLSKDEKFRNIIVDDLYQIFNEFQQRLNIIPK